MKRCWGRYVAFWSEREAPHSLALWRIAFALALLASLAEQVLAGTVVEQYAAPEHGGIFAVYPPEAPLSLLRVLPATVAVVWGLVAAQAVGGLLLMVGLYTRAAAVVCFVTQVTFYDRAWIFVFGGDNVFRVFLFLMVLAPA